MLRKIVTIGPESTGKSTLSEALAVHFDTVWVPEYAREFLTRHGTQYQYADLLTIARGQCELEDRVSAGARKELAFVDTDMYVMKVWCEFVFGKCHPFILDQIVSRRYDLYLLCNTDLPWTRDELREYPDLENRLRLFHLYKDILVNQSVPWVEIRGEEFGDRRAQAISAVEELLAR